MNLTDLIRTAHRLAEAQEQGRRITQKEMAARIGVSSRAYSEYQTGTNCPLGMKALLRLLNGLSDREIVRLVREYRDDAAEK
ncbi:helix-turn-helix domain-containing protein [Paraburkholderia largidicola]|nr:helix-turn-helix transcriptional regulator [Paraburkholderia sp. PGU16]